MRPEIEADRSPDRTAEGTDGGEPVSIVYDGQCPFCSAYVRMVRLRDVVGTVRLVDARSADPVVEEAVAAGLDLDRGMALKMDGRLYYGDECIHILSLLSTPSGVFNRTMRFIFRSRRIARVVYPIMVACRNATLWLLGRRKIADVGA